MIAYVNTLILIAPVGSRTQIATLEGLYVTNYTTKA